MSPRPTIGPRLRRVLALVPFIAAHPGIRLDAVAARFQITGSELERDLELLPFCGLPPYTADRLIDVEILDGQVWIRFAEYFGRSLRLTAGEGLALLTAGRALLAVPGSDPGGPLASALGKLAAVVDTGEGLEVDVGGGPFLAALREAADAHERVEIHYYSFGRDALTTRAIDPRSVFHAFGHWYVAAFCHLADDERLFRVDRVRAVHPTGARFTPPADDVADALASRVYHPRPGDPRVTLRLAPSAAWVVETYPSEDAVALPDGSWRVVLAVSERAWLERLLLRLGPDAEVVDPPAYREVAEVAASRLLARYDRASGGSA